MHSNRFYTYNSETGEIFRKPRERSEFLSDWHHNEHLRHCKKPCGNVMKREGGIPVAIVVNKPKGHDSETLAHRIAWSIIHGSIPDGMHIDHINGNPTDNRLQNLRLVTAHQNMRNSRRHHVNSHGVKGVCWDKKNGKWSSEIRTPNRRVFLGRHDTKGMAALAYAKASLQYHGEHSYYRRPVPRISVPPEDIERMKRLGYLQD